MLAASVLLLMRKLVCGRWGRSEACETTDTEGVVPYGASEAIGFACLRDLPTLTIARQDRQF